MISIGFIKSPIFYMGNKFDLLPQIFPYFPDNVNVFYDLFGGSGCISGNVIANKIVYNELNDNIVKLYDLFLKYSDEELISYIKDYITKFDLNIEGVNVKQNDSTAKKTREYYNQNYIKFRDAYNKSDKDYRMLYTLTFYSFSNLIRFNSKEEFNMPYGNRCFCKKHEDQIRIWCKLIHSKNIITMNRDAFDILEHTQFNSDDFVYCDPPYSNTLAIYNENRAHGGWSIEDDLKLFSYLEKLDKQGIKWGLSNVFENKGKKNIHLIEWCEKNGWNVQHLNFSYSSLGKGNANSDEVYICNYTSNADKQQNLVKYDLWGDLLDE